MGKATKAGWMHEGLSLFFAVTVTIIVVVVVFSVAYTLYNVRVF